jgi:hypothetical protein
VAAARTHQPSEADLKAATLTKSQAGAVNNDYRHGDLLAEIICATTVNQQDAVLACENYTNQIPIRNMSQNISVTGP